MQRLARDRSPWRSRRWPWVLILGWVLSLGIAVGTRGARADDEPTVQAARLLERMTRALRTLDYQGTLVYLIDNRLETLYLTHRIAQGRVQERLVSLSGPVRTLDRERDRVTCLLPDAQPLSVARHAAPSRSATGPIDPVALAGRYHIEVRGAARVAGRDASVLMIRPRDQLRYGYQFYLDRATGLPLKSDLINAQGEAIEQLLFTSIDLGSETPSAAPAAAAQGSAARSAGAPETLPQSPPAPTRWRFDGRPPGFELAAHDLMEDGQGAAVEHFVFSDQLSSYSLFIEPGAADGLRGGTRIGAVHAAGGLVNGHQVTAVGEVPAATVAAAVAGLGWAADGAPP
ncbi:MucB/RseB C-terminal domain-containing protein [Candidatus Thiodictyon syntrophicum]|jgi:sigma-E factor negative regulatory protein RseB|uniref:Transcriptional regulator n=1 Tax=Candidatus Thiodictyon syntrophicum TaxID=1166950 RepID=A0A2K8U5S8_9GAMM|nr:MucB/RseB C-terminal domain-containing protein [Candidatus Thiodictyon syntrophicum]AUB80948.1 transcriptional regulator [Candidatus Thiodictyon syntrophicum]